MIKCMQQWIRTDLLSTRVHVRFHVRKLRTGWHAARKACERHCRRLQECYMQMHNHSCHQISALKPVQPYTVVYCPKIVVLRCHAQVGS